MNYPSKYHPWAYFLFTALSLALLSYTALGPAWKWGIALLGLVLPTLWAWAAPRNPHSLDAQEKEAPWIPPRWFPVLLILLAFFLRFHSLTTLSTWPLPDEGVCASYSIDLLRDWHWRFFFHYTQIPGPFFWLLALFFRLFEPSLFSLWLFPALFCAVTVGLCYLALRSIFPRSFSCLYLFFLTFNFWHLYTGRLCLPMGLLFLWQILTYWVLAIFLVQSRPRQKSLWAALLGLVTGLGFWTSIAWPFVLVSLIPAVWLVGKKRGNTYQVVPLLFLSILLIFSFPYLAAAVHERYGIHLSHLWVFGKGWSWAVWAESLKNIGGIFTNPDEPFHYGPLWGGMLNPVEGALALLGTAECCHRWKTAFCRWVLFALVLSLAPGLLSRDFEIMRLMSALPLLLLLVTMGGWTLIKGGFSKTKMTATILILTLSSGLNLYHLEGPYHRLWGTPQSDWYLLKSGEFYRAYRILGPLEKEEGPGAVLSDLWGKTGDGTLTVACYSFDAAHNPLISLEGARWVAVILDANYKPFLAKRFTKGRWFWLGSLRPGNPGGLMMGVIPLAPENRKILLQWVEANLHLEAVTSSVLNSDPQRPPQRALDLLLQIGPSLPSDPFLKSCFWEKAYNLYRAGNNPEGMLEALRQGLKEGYPLAHFYNEEGLLLESAGKNDEARRAFQKALHAPLNLTSAAENLHNLP